MSAPRIFTPEYYARMRALEADGWWNAAMRDVSAMLLDEARLPRSGELLDVGCGSGQTITWAETVLPGWRMTGLDLSLDGLRSAHDVGIAVSRSSALALPYADASVDLVITLDVLQHLPLDGGDSIALVEMRRVLKPGGVLLLRTNAQAFPRTADDADFDFHKYEPGELHAKLRTSGFSVLRLSRINALLGLAEIARELRATRSHGDGYHGLIAAPAKKPSRAESLKRRWLRLEGRAVRAGLALPLGRTICALCRAESAG